MTGSLIVLGLLRNTTSYVSRITLVVEVDVIHGGEVVSLLTLLKSEVGGPQLRMIYSGIRLVSGLRHELFLCLRDVADLWLIAKVDIRALQCEVSSGSGLRNALRSAAYGLLIYSRSVFQVPFVCITDFKANLSHLSAQLLSQFLALR